TAAAGVDVFAALDALSTALGANDLVTTRASVDSMASANTQVARARADVGVRIQALDDADDARRSFETALARTHQDAVEADPIAAATSLVRSRSALDDARALAE